MHHFTSQGPLALLCNGVGCKVKANRDDAVALITRCLYGMNILFPKPCET